MTIDERLEAITMNMELHGHAMEDLRRQMAAAAAGTEARRIQAEIGMARVEDALVRSSASQDDLREDVRSLANSVALFMQSEQEIDHQFRAEMKVQRAATEVQREDMKVQRAATEAQAEFNRQFRAEMKDLAHTNQILARIVARHDDWIDRQGAA